MQTGTLIIGGGLAGLGLASRLAERKHPFLLVEARERLGGRILTETAHGGYFDLGPAWFWPGQPRIESLVSELGLTRFEQYASGQLTYEDELGNVQRGRGFASMQGSCRLVGGLGALVSALSGKLPPKSVLTSTRITQLRKLADGVRATTGDGRSIIAERVVLALPPRIAAKIAFSPALPGRATAAMNGIATWMAGQAKAVAVFERAFWREAGLSGDVMSRRGPMAEIHDASAEDGSFHALFGFIGVPPRARSEERSLRKALLSQLERLFGPAAAEPKELYLKDWAADALTATEPDLQPLFAHPQYGLPHALTNLWEDRVLLGGTEVATHFGGYLEGALEAAETVLRKVESAKSQKRHDHRHENSPAG
ncbi:flavin monoamine oxidase family protein [Roseibium sp.]|uniref:flavin monoamine oxidase family protein n=1 Tax=Roseibium sp. TaxID=1936156 RepID=UPI003D12ABED